MWVQYNPGWPLWLKLVVALSPVTCCLCTGIIAFYWYAWLPIRVHVLCLSLFVSGIPFGVCVYRMSCADCSSWLQYPPLEKIPDEKVEEFDSKKVHLWAASIIHLFPWH